MTWQLRSTAAANRSPRPGVESRNPLQNWKPRPSYPHIRRVVLAERDRRQAIAEALREVASTIAAGRAPDFDYTMRRLHEAGVLE